MKLNKELGTILYELYGLNGSDGVVHISQKRRFTVYQELARHGLIELKERQGSHSKGLFNAIRLCRQLRLQ